LAREHIRWKDIVSKSMETRSICVEDQKQSPCTHVVGSSCGHLGSKDVARHHALLQEHDAFGSEDVHRDV
jgi:hypothetical protein